MLLNIAALAVLILFGCHNPFMFNQSTLVLGYLASICQAASVDLTRDEWYTLYLAAGNDLP